MELRQLEYYVAVVQHGSILQAASALNLSCLLYTSCDHFSDRSNWQFINILSGEPINPRAEINMLQNK